MAPRKASPKSKLNAKGKEESEADGLLAPAPGAGPSRRSARQANVKWNSEYASTAVKRENDEDESGSDVDLPTRNKRAAPGSPGSVGSVSKRVKFDSGEDGNVKVEVGLLSPDITGSEGEDSDGYVSHEGKSEDEEKEDENSEVDSDLSEDDDDDDFGKKQKTKKGSRSTPKKAVKKTKVKSESPSTPKAGKATSKSTGSPKDKAASLQSKKLKSFAQFSKKSPFPDFLHPTADEARLAHRILAKLHGERVRPKEVVARSDVAGCGDSPSVLDALVRTILSQNTSDKNSTRAKLSMDKVYGGSDQWDEIIRRGQPTLQEAIKSGGLSVVKSKVIISILEQTKEKYGKFSLDHLFDKSDEDAMQELISFQGVGPKTASCVLLFCLQRESFAVDTHVYRIAGLLGWRPQEASRDETHAHLEVRIPDEDKYGLHILMVGHGKKCDECKAGGKSVGKCELRKAFRKGKLKGEAGEEIKEEEEKEVKDEDEDASDQDEIKKEEDDMESGQSDYVHGMQAKNKQKSPKGKKK